jgi:iron complex transport system permease protein
MKRRAVVLGALALAALAGVLVAPLLGLVSLADLRGVPVFWTIRVPRTALAFLAGSGLSLAGMTFQAMFRNPLVEPFTLGVSSGAAFGATLAIRLGWMFSVLGISTISIAAFAGALLSLLLVYGLSVSRGSHSTAILLLAGVAMSFFFWSLILFVQYLSDFSGSFRILRWLMGGVETVGYDAVLDVLPFVLSGAAVILCYARELNLLTLGEDLALSRGVAVAPVRALLFTASTLMVGGVVAVCGPIGFVGLIAPHICRLLIGTDHRFLAPATLLFGGLFLVACDTLARLIIAPAELPVGVLTALLGGPFFVWLLLRRSRSGGVLA